MKSKWIIGVMTIIWLLLMANILWKGTDGKWYVGDAEKIGELEIAKYTNQIVVVAVSMDEAWLSLYEKNEMGYWELILETEAIIGENGLGKCKEGDGKTPVGTYRFTKAFGILNDPGAKIDYVKVNESHYWVDDCRSEYYNQFVSTDEVSQDWITAEHLCEYGQSYHYVLALSYNLEGIPGRGSAVFLHCTSESSRTTAGCIAIPEVYMREITKRVTAQCVLVIDDRDNILKY